MSEVVEKKVRSWKNQQKINSGPQESYHSRITQKPHQGLLRKSPSIGKHCLEILPYKTMRKSNRIFEKLSIGLKRGSNYPAKRHKNQYEIKYQQKPADYLEKRHLNHLSSARKRSLKTSAIIKTPKHRLIRPTAIAKP